MINAKKLIYLDGVKGVACILIFIHHFLLAFFPAYYYGKSVVSHASFNVDYYFSQSPVSVLANGNFFVCIFLILSAFVIAYQIFIFPDDYDRLSKLTMKRYFRLSLPISVVCFLVYLLMKFNLFSNIQVATITNSSWLSSYYRTTLSLKDVFKDAFINIWFLGSSSFSTAFWMLNILFISSFIAIILSILGRKANIKILILYLAIFIVYLKVNPYYTSSVLGVTLAFIFIKQSNIIQRINKYYFPVIFLIIGMFLGGYPTGVQPTNIYKYLNHISLFITPSLFYHMVGALFTILSILTLPSIQHLFSKKMFLFLGRISFSVYMLHIPILFSFSTYFFKILFEHKLTYQISVLITFIITLIILIFTSTIFYNFIEKNCNKLSDKIAGVFIE